MLTKHPLLAGKLVEAWTEDAYRRVTLHGGKVDEYHEQPKVQLVIDESDDVIAAVSDKYTLVRNADLVSALDVAADERGLVLAPTMAAYRNGRAKYAFNVPALEYQVTRDPSITIPQIIVRNDYRGGGGLHVQSGYFRVVCTNGAMRGTIAYSDNQRHVGKFDLRKFLGGAIDRIKEIFEVDRLLAETLAATSISEPQQRELVTHLLEFTAKRYQPDLERAVRENVREMGANAWALVQAAAEVATHRMQTNVRGVDRRNYNFAADQWAARVEAAIHEHTGVK